jgi:hypothetical protein
MVGKSKVNDVSSCSIESCEGFLRVRFAGEAEAVPCEG